MKREIKGSSEFFFVSNSKPRPRIREVFILFSLSFLAIKCGLPCKDIRTLCYGIYDGQ